MNILLVATVYRCGEKIYPVIEPLAKRHSIDVFCLGQMSENTPWPGNVDLRKPFYKKCSEVCTNVIQGAGHAGVGKHYRDGKKLCSSLNLSSYDVVLIDDNLCKSGWGLPAIYRECKRAGVKTVIGSPHGNRGTDEKFVVHNLDRSYDYSFVFGKKEREFYGKKQNQRNRLIPGGIPSNDKLSSYLNNKPEYILIIPNYTEPNQAKRAGFRCFRRKTFVDCGVPQLSRKLSLPVVVKEKSKFPRSKQSKSLQKQLAKFGDVRFLLDVKDDNLLISKAACVISAPSTLAFKPIQMGIPTVVLDGFGLLGNFHDFRGLVEPSHRAVMRTVERQMSHGRDGEWIRHTLEGGVDYRSTDCYVGFIESLVD